MSLIPEYVATPLKDIPQIASNLRDAFDSQKTKPIAYRLQQLRKLYWALKDHEAAVLEACKRDLGKSAFETYLTEFTWCLNDIIFVQSNLAEWAKDESAPDIDLMNKALNPKIRKEPLGCVLILGTYNFPIQLCLGPLIGAIAAGCTAVLKPSESAPSAATVLQSIIASSLDPTAYTLVQGAIPESTALLSEKWDKIFYTGGASVAKIIALKAAETLTPVTLELGGKNPAIVTASADVALAARRLLWAKTFNAGQVCVSQNYTLVDASVLDAFLAALATSLSEFYPAGARASPDYGRIVNATQFARLEALLASTHGKIVLGGSSDRASLFFEPTVILLSSADDPLLTTESFGPLLPILAVPDLSTALRTAARISATPLGVYAFGSAADTSRVLDTLRSGGATLNDGFNHAAVPTLAFGGVGESGSGAYRGRASFECFSHRRSVVRTPAWLELLLGVRYPPFEGTGKLKTYRRMAELKPGFDREGRASAGWGAWVVLLGAGGVGKGLLRWLAVVLVAVGWQRFGDAARGVWEGYRGGRV